MFKRISKILSVSLPVTFNNNTAAVRLGTQQPVFFPYDKNVKISRIWGQLRSLPGGNFIGGFNSFMSFIEPSGSAILTDPIRTASTFISTNKAFANVGTAFQTTFDNFYAAGFVLESGIFTRSGELVVGTVYELIISFEIEFEVYVPDPVV